MNQHSKLLLILLAVSSLSLNACSEKKSVAKSDSQVAMKVNGEAVTVEELNDKTGHPDDSKKYSISGPMIKMINGTVLLQQAALQAKMDADPVIHARIVNASRGILATAYLEKQLAAVGKPSAEDISAYFNQHPERFANRTLYEMQELSIQPPPGKEGEVQTQAGNSKKFTEFEQWLTENNIPHTSNPVSKMTDEMGEEVLQKLMKAPVGGAVVLGDKGQMNVIFVLGKKTQPASLEESKRGIEFTLMNKRKGKVVDDTLKQLRDKAKIEYLPPYTADGFVAPVDHK